MTWDALGIPIITLTTGEIIIVILNLIFIVFSQSIVKRFCHKDTNDKSINLRTALLRGFNVAILAYCIFDLLARAKDTTIAIQAISILGILYFAHLANYLTHYFIYFRYGKPRNIGGKKIYIETYQSRALSLLSTLAISVIALIWGLNILGFDDLTKAGGALGVIGVMIGLTQGSWAPDIISGLILLHSDVFEEGDVIEIEQNSVGLIYKTKMFHTEVLNLTNNHRIMIRNAKLRDMTIHNLSKFASARGLRECLTFNISYETPSEEVKHMFWQAYESAKAADIKFEHQHEIEVKLLETGDHAVTWGFIYYVKSVDQLVLIRRNMREIIFNTSLVCNISLATPTTHQGHLDIRSMNEPVLSAAQ